MIDRYKVVDGVVVRDDTGDLIKYVDYLSEEGNWVPFEDYKFVSEQMRELLSNLRKEANNG